MPQAITLGRTSKYVQITLTDRYAPRCEPMHTTEVKGKKRYGEGLLYRVVGRLALGVGRWTTPPDVEKIRAIEGFDELHLVNESEFEELRARFNDTNEKKLREGWNPPVWHWRRYQEALLPCLVKFRLVTIEAYGDPHFRRPRWWPFTPTVPGWKPMAVVEELPTVQVDDADPAPQQCDFPRDETGRISGEGCATHGRLDLAAGQRCPDDPRLKAHVDDVG
jgi:hypothetical protein